MPFIKENHAQDPQPSLPFTGRTGEILFFIHNILKPDAPTHNVLSISGQGGVGKSTLVSRFLDEVNTSEHKDYCLAALVDERQATPVSIMEKFAQQLHIAGKFERMLKQYKEALRKRQAEGKTLQDALFEGVPDMAGAAIGAIPVAGPFLEGGAKVATTYALKKYQASQLQEDAEFLETAVDELTRAFIIELNHLADTKVTLSSTRKKRQRRIVLFFDTFEQLAAEATLWLLNRFLEAQVSNNVVLVVAGRDPIERTFPDDPKRWLPYCDGGDIYWISLNSFTEDETRAYLIGRRITDAHQIANIWQLSRGLPLYLGLLTSNPSGDIDPTKDVVGNFLRWIPEQEAIKRQLALDAAFFSRSFNQDDLDAFTYVSKQERLTLYRWLIGQPFVRVQGDRYTYHDIARELFRHYLYQHSRKGYYATRRALAHYYQRLLEEIQREEGKEVYRSTEWFTLVLALLYQLLCLPDEASHIQAIKQVLHVLIHRDGGQVFHERIQEIRRVLRELSERVIDDTNLCTQQVIKHLRQWFEPSTRGKEQLESVNSLLRTVVHEPSFPPKLLAWLYWIRGETNRELKGHHQQAIDDFQRAFELLDPTAHRDRGRIYLDLGEYQQTIHEFNEALELDSHDAQAYEERGWAYFFLKEYQQAIDDFERVLELDSNNIQGHNGRGQIHMRFKEYQQALIHIERIVELVPTDYLGYVLRGTVYRELKEYQRAIDDLEYALELNPYCCALGERGYVYLWLKDMEQALEDFTRWWELNPTSIGDGWMVEWVSMCQRGVSSHTPERLEELIADAPYPTRYYPRVCRGVVLLLHKRYEEALAELEQAIPLSWSREPWDAYFWKGMACVFLDREEEAMETIEKALGEGMPPVLLAPLRRFEQERPDFYEKYVVSLLAKHA